MKFLLFIFRKLNTAQQASLGFIARQEGVGKIIKKKRFIIPFYILVP